MDDELEELTQSSAPGKPRRSLPTETFQRSVADHLLGSLERLIQRHRSLTLYDAQHSGLHAELIAAEVMHELAMARSALYGPSCRR
jgi:hypothetical protein